MIELFPKNFEYENISPDFLANIETKEKGKISSFTPSRQFGPGKDILDNQSSSRAQTSCLLDQFNDADKAIFNRKLSILIDSQLCLKKDNSSSLTGHFFPNEHESLERRDKLHDIPPYKTNSVHSARRLSQERRKFASSFWKNGEDWSRSRKSSIGNLPSCNSLTISSGSLSSLRARTQSQPYPRRNSLFVLADSLKSNQNKRRKEKDTISGFSSLCSFGFSSDSLVSSTSHYEPSQRRNSLFLLADALETDSHICKGSISKSNVDAFTTKTHSVSPYALGSPYQKKRKLSSGSHNESLTSKQINLNFSIDKEHVCTMYTYNQRPSNKKIKVESTGRVNTNSKFCKVEEQEVTNGVDPAKGIKDFFFAMKSSEESQAQIHEWDKKMGLRRSHSKTMRSSMKTRKALLSVLNSDIVSCMESRLISHPCVVSAPLA